MSRGVSAVVPNKDGTGLVGRCVAAALAAGASEVIVVDDGSTDASPDEAAAAGAKVIQSTGRGFSAAVNTGAATASREHLLLLNSDCFVEPEAIGRLVEALQERPSLGACGAALVEEDGSPARSHGHELTLWLALRAAVSLILRVRPTPAPASRTSTSCRSPACSSRARPGQSWAGSTSAIPSTSRITTSAGGCGRRAGASPFAGTPVPSTSAAAPRNAGSRNGGFANTTRAERATSASGIRTPGRCMRPSGCRVPSHTRSPGWCAADRRAASGRGPTSPRPSQVSGARSPRRTAARSAPPARRPSGRAPPARRRRARSGGRAAPRRRPRARRAERAEERLHLEEPSHPDEDDHGCSERRHDRPEHVAEKLHRRHPGRRRDQGRDDVGERDEVGEEGAQRHPPGADRFREHDRQHHVHRDRGDQEDCEALLPGPRDQELREERDRLVHEQNASEQRQDGRTLAVSGVPRRPAAGRG